MCTNVIPGLGNVTAGEGEEKKESKERKRRRDEETEKRGNGGTADTFHPVRAVRNARSLSPPPTRWKTNSFFQAQIGE